MSAGSFIYRPAAPSMYAPCVTMLPSSDSIPPLKKMTRKRDVQGAGTEGVCSGKSERANEKEERLLEA